MKNILLINLLEEKLAIPISDIIEQNGNYMIKSDGISIGKISISDFQFNKNRALPINIISKLRWDFVFNRNRIDIEAAVKKHYSASNIKITLGTFGNLYIKELDKNGVESVLAKVKCKYTKELGWFIELIESL